MTHLMIMATVVGWAVFSGISAAEPPARLRITDVDGRERELNATGRVTAVIYSNPQVQDWTRQAGKALDEFQGRRDFRIVVVVDLRGTMADWAPGYTVRRMQRDLDAEAQRVLPFYKKNDNGSDPRQDMSAVADFKGEVCRRLGWQKPLPHHRVVIFGKNGLEAAREENQSDLGQLRAWVAEALKK